MALSVSGPAPELEIDGSMLAVALLVAHGLLNANPVMLFLR
ncbi:hypothetical protein [Mycobacterium sp. PSTR-4-N]|nr:hypothetical protein [Mycobacterium sp. PSTR-4-N]